MEQLIEKKDHVVRIKSDFLAKKVEKGIPPASNATNSDIGNPRVAIAESAAVDKVTTISTSERTQERVDNRGAHGNQSGKKRPRETRAPPENRLCTTTARGEVCTYGETCKYTHDVLSFLSTKPADIGSACYQFTTFGYCPNGLMCRYGSHHIDFTNGQNLARSTEQGGVVDRVQINVLSKDLQSVLRKKKYEKEFNSTAYDKPVKLVDFRNKVYIAPLTTVGNLPFRRILKDFGADITCGEMAMADNLLNGQGSEWALLRKHSSENCFGIQVAGSIPALMGKVAKVIDNETESDYVDINCGCPIDILCNHGCGAALMNKPGRLCEIVSVMSKQLTTRPLTVKIRTGWSESDPSAHKLVQQIQKVANGRVAAVFVHGRSRLQRYHRLANWDYVAQVAKSQNKELPLIPIIGNGDIFSYEDWASHQSLLSEKLEGDSESLGLCSCAMIGRGALIKPWIPTEIKDRVHLDISASERLDMLKKFCNYGMEHWGSDQQGINTIRRFLLEWLSFLHRYIPVGLLEYGQGAQKMSQRPPAYFGRCDMETLMASSNSKVRPSIIQFIVFASSLNTHVY